MYKILYEIVYDIGIYCICLVFMYLDKVVKKKLVWKCFVLNLDF